MQKRHFNEIARVLSAARPTMSDTAHARLVDEFAHVCASFNSNFKRDTFKLACSASVKEERAPLVMNERQAKLLAGNDRDYSARRVQGRWVVWSAASDHVVEFDDRTIESIIQSDYELSRG